MASCWDCHEGFWGGHVLEDPRGPRPFTCMISFSQPPPAPAEMVPAAISVWRKQRSRAMQPPLRARGGTGTPDGLAEPAGSFYSPSPEGGRAAAFCVLDTQAVTSAVMLPMAPDGVASTRRPCDLEQSS